MKCSIRAAGSGKIARVRDMIAGVYAFNGFLDSEEVQALNVGSNDGSNGKIVVEARMDASKAWVKIVDDYEIAKNEEFPIDDL